MNQLAIKLFAGVIRGAAALALAALWVVTAPLNAEAALQGSAGNTVIRNTITVNYKDSNGNLQTPVASSIDITVNTVAAAPTIVSVATSPGNSDGTGAQVVHTFRIRTNSNGPGAISFSSADGTFTNLAAGTAPTVPGNIFLGSTVIDPLDPMTPVVALANGSPVTYRVPNDGAVPTDAAVSGGLINDGIINGLKATNMVYLYSGSGYYGPFTVTTVTDPAVGALAVAAYGTLVLTNASGGPLTYTPAYGWQIVEAKDVTVTVTQGVVSDPTALASWVTTLTATMGGLNTSAPTATTNANMGKIDIKKYVRNVTTPAAGSNPFPGNPLAINSGSFSYYQTGITGKPGEILEYLAVLTDTGRGNSTAVYATDVTPTYVTLVSATTYGGGTAGLIFAHAKFGANETDLKTDDSGGLLGTAVGKSTGTAPGSTMTFNLGTGCTKAYPTGGGTLTYNQAAYVIYQVKIE